jgi:hypothetical protein
MLSREEKSLGTHQERYIHNHNIVEMRFIFVPSHDKN